MLLSDFPASIFMVQVSRPHILVFKKCRKEDDNILFLLMPARSLKRLMTPEQTPFLAYQEDCDTYRAQRRLKNTAILPCKKWHENDHNLNILITLILGKKNLSTFILS